MALFRKIKGSLILPSFRLPIHQIAEGLVYTKYWYLSNEKILCSGLTKGRDPAGTAMAGRSDFLKVMNQL
jgi:hypothetical protein